MKGEIRAESYIQRGIERVPVEELSPEQRENLAVRLKLAYLNELFRGKARVFCREEKEKT